MAQRTLTPRPTAAPGEAPHSDTNQPSGAGLPGLLEGFANAFQPGRAASFAAILAAPTARKDEAPRVTLRLV